MTESNEKTKLNGFIACYNIKGLDLPPTRTTFTSANSLDWICINFEENHFEIEIL